jgi:hypothetical protein
MSLIQATRADVARFMKYVVVLPCGCWLWAGARSRGGGKKGQRVWYGSFSYYCARLKKRVTVRAHRFSSEVLGKKDCPPGHDRDHKCELSLCVNPECIEIVPKAVNQERKVTRRRLRDVYAVDRALEMYDAQ